MEGHTISLIASAITGILMLLLGVISWFLRDKVKENDGRVARLEDRTQRIEVADAKRDAEMTQVSAGISQIGELRAELALRYVSREELAKILGKLEKIESEITTIRVAQAGAQAADRSPRRRHDTSEDPR
jgi:hypothetical protein